MGILQSKLFRWTLFGAALTLAAIWGSCSTPEQSTAPDAPAQTTAQQVDESDEEQEPQASTEQVQQGAVQEVTNSQAVDVEVHQGLVNDPAQCNDMEICTRDWALQTIGIALQVRADELLLIARSNGAPEEWLTAHMRANTELLDTETAMLGGVLDGSAYQNGISTQRSIEIAATAIAIQMHQQSKLPTGEGTSVVRLLDFSESLLQAQYEKFPHLTADTRTQIEDALEPDRSDELAARMARSVRNGTRN